MSDDIKPSWTGLFGIDPDYPETETCSDCAALAARLRSTEAKLAAARSALAAFREVRQAQIQREGR